ncbi:MAG TPA: hypothetical protein VLH86_01825 [Patescibacteria group bacterium]|nr:hypothetical protein [Patescibacteria group bacterium]
MNKRSLHHLWTRIRPVRTWYLLLLCVIFGVIGVVSLRNNYATMVSLRSNVYAADRNNTDVVGALNKLRSFVNAHMNTSLADGSGVYPPIQLTHTYERLQAAEKARVADTTSKIYTDAQHHCEQLYPGSFSGGPRVPCIEQYVKDHGTTERTIPAELYKFNFATPTWSPDLAGITLAFSALFFALAVLRFVAGRILEAITR